MFNKGDLVLVKEVSLDPIWDTIPNVWEAKQKLLNQVVQIVHIMKHEPKEKHEHLVEVNLTCKTGVGVCFFKFSELELVFS